MTEVTEETEETPETVCPACGAAVRPSDAFCESCGGELTPTVLPGDPAHPDAGTGDDEAPFLSAPTRAPRAAAADGTTQAMPVTDADGFALPRECPECGGAFAADGYCENCGARAPRPRDHFTERPADWVGGACDRGLRHHRNEDAMALWAAEGTDIRRAVLVVCDGVSSAADSDVASLRAARAARDVLSLSQARGLGTPESYAAAVQSRVTAAAAAAQEAVLSAVSADNTGNPPSCTFVAGVLEGDLLVVGNIGDSRAYWFPDGGAAQALTTDDSWASLQMADGVDRATAENGPQAHAITRWLGQDAPDAAPTLGVHTVAEPGWLLLCSDGLWNYASDAASLRQQLDAAAVAGTSTGPTDPVLLAERLVGWAKEQGGRDNITVALARVGPLPEPTAPSAPQGPVGDEPD